MFKIFDILLLNGSDFTISQRSAMYLRGNIDKLPANVLGQLLLSHFEAGIQLLKLLHGFVVHAYNILDL